MQKGKFKKKKKRSFKVFCSDSKQNIIIFKNFTIFDIRKLKFYKKRENEDKNLELQKYTSIKKRIICSCQLYIYFKTVNKTL